MALRRYAMVLAFVMCCSRKNADAQKQPAGAQVPSRDPLASCEHHVQEHATAWTCSNGMYVMDVVAPLVFTREQVDSNLKGYGTSWSDKGFRLDPADFVFGGKSYPSVRATGENEGPQVAQLVIAPTPKKDTHLIQCVEHAKQSTLCADVLPFLLNRAIH